MTVVCTGTPCANASSVTSTVFPQYFQRRVSSLAEKAVGSPPRLGSEIIRLPTKKCVGVKGSGSPESTITWVNGQEFITASISVKVVVNSSKVT